MVRCCGAAPEGTTSRRESRPTVRAGTTSTLRRISPRTRSAKRYSTGRVSSNDTPATCTGSDAVRSGPAKGAPLGDPAGQSNRSPLRGCASQYGCVSGASAGAWARNDVDAVAVSRKNRAKGLSASLSSGLGISAMVQPFGPVTSGLPSVMPSVVSRNARTSTDSSSPGVTVSALASGSSVMPAAEARASTKSRSLKASRKSASARASGVAAVSPFAAVRAARVAVRPRASAGTMVAGVRAS